MRDDLPQRIRAVVLVYLQLVRQPVMLSFADHSTGRSLAAGKQCGRDDGSGTPLNVHVDRVGFEPTYNPSNLSLGWAALAAELPVRLALRLSRLTHSPHPYPYRVASPATQFRFTEPL